LEWPEMVMKNGFPPTSGTEAMTRFADIACAFGSGRAYDGRKTRYVRRSQFCSEVAEGAVMGELVSGGIP
jgi:hypothetical protein